MLKPSISPSTQYQYVCTQLSEVPEAAYPFINAELLGKLGQSTRAMFPEFANAFPLTMLAMEAYWPLQPKLTLHKSYASKNWLHKFVLEREDLNLFFIEEWDPSSERFDQYHMMLPTKWKELYRWFDSFSIRENSMGGFVSSNTPFDYSSRLDIDDFCAQYRTKKSELKKFASSIASKKIRCWMVTEAKDSLWLDEDHCDHKVYHVKNHNFNDVYVLPTPEETLDKYLAHYVSGGNPADFDFRIDTTAGSDTVLNCKPFE